MSETIQDILNDMSEVCKKYDAIGAGHAAQPIHNWRRRLQAVIDTNTAWREDVCNRLGLDTTAGTLWSPQEVYEHVRQLERDAAADVLDVAADLMGPDTLVALPNSDTIFRRPGGGLTHCEICKANVFSKTADPNYYLCNGCNAGYTVEHHYD